MVLTKTKGYVKSFWFPVFFFMVLSYKSYGIGFDISYRIETLQQSPYKIFIPALEIVKESARFQLLDTNYSYICDTEYIIKNNGESVTQTIGITSFGYSRFYPPDSIEFLVNGKKYDYERFLVPPDPDKEGQNWRQDWFFIDVHFDQGSEISVRVIYENRLATFGGEQMCIFYGIIDPVNDNWYANVQSSLFIENTNEKYYWMADIYFDDKEQRDSLSLSGIMADEDTMDTSLFDLDLINNTDFILRFKDSARPPIIKILVLSMTKWMEATQYFNAYNDGIVLFYNGLSDRTLERYVIRDYELVLLSLYQLRILRNSIYAQYGYIFNDVELQNLFETPPYARIRNCKSKVYNENLILETEQKNIQIIRDLELLRMKIKIPD
jgi:hypothetical protein